MNETINIMKAHRSIRNYTGEAVKEEHLRAIIESAIHAPTSINGQQWSIIVIEDQAKKDRIAELAGGQPWISKCSVFMVFLMDYHKVAKKMEAQGIPFEHATSIESVMVGAVDVGIAFSNAMTAAESLGYGIVPIGAIRREPFEIIELLGLPKYVYPVLGMCIGVEAGDQGLKPRLPYDATVSIDIYNAETDTLVADYDALYKEYLAQRPDTTMAPAWTEFVGSVYNRVYFPKVKSSLEQQGFTAEK